MVHNVPNPADKTMEGTRPYADKEGPLLSSAVLD